MNEFFQALGSDTVPFLRYAFLTGVIASVAFGVVGTYVVTRRISYIAGAISHCVLGGIGMALYCQYKFQLTWCKPMVGAIVAALVAALVIGMVSMVAKQREDTVIGALWAIGMATGLLFIHATPGYIDPMSYLFGDIQMISQADLWTVTALDLLVLIVALLFYNKFLAVCFDEEFARIRGLRVEFYYLLLLCLTALTIVLLVTVVGIVMVIAMLTLPAAIAGHFTKRLWKMMVVACFLSLLFTSSGLCAAYMVDLPSGPMIIVIAGAFYLVTATATTLWGKLSR